MQPQKEKRKRKYIPHKAAASFEPTYDWSKEEAKQKYETRKFPFDVERTFYSDCKEGMKTLPEKSVDMVLADPPFGLDFSGKEAIYNRDSNNVIEGYEEVDIEDYPNFTDEWIGELPRIMKRDAGVWIFSGWTNLKDVLYSLDKHKLDIINHIIWKYQFGVFTKRKFVTSHYHILFAVKDKKSYFFNKFEHYPQDVWLINRKYMPNTKKNATKLPVNVVMRCIDFGSEPGDLILDPFMGNGTTAVAAKCSFRHYLGFEMNDVLKEIIDWNLKQVKLGELYQPYIQRPDEIVQNAKEKFQKSDSSETKLTDYLK